MGGGKTRQDRTHSPRKAGQVGVRVARRTPALKRSRRRFNFHDESSVALNCCTRILRTPANPGQPPLESRTFARGPSFGAEAFDCNSMTATVSLLPGWL